MTYRFSALFPVIVAGALSMACGEDMHDQSSGSMQNELQAGRTEVDRHHDAVLHAATLAALPIELERHMGRMGNIKTQMNRAMDGMMMSHCEGSGMSRMHDMIGSMSADVQAYQAGMAHAATLEEARSQCSAYTHTMQGLFQNMQITLNGMGCMPTMH